MCFAFSFHFACLFTFKCFYCWKAGKQILQLSQRTHTNTQWIFLSNPVFNSIYFQNENLGKWRRTSEVVHCNHCSQVHVKHLFMLSATKLWLNWIFSVFLSFNLSVGTKNINSQFTPIMIHPYTLLPTCDFFWFFLLCFCCGLILRAAFNCDKLNGSN